MRRLILAIVTLAALMAPATTGAGAQTGGAAPVEGDVQPTPQSEEQAAEAGRQAGPPPDARVVAGEGPGAATPGTGGSHTLAFATFRVFATQYQPNTPGSVEVAVPDKCAKFAALKNQTVLNQFGCPAGYRLDLDYRVAVTRDNGQSAIFPVKDVGPWNIDDNYWAGPGSSRPRRMFGDLRRGTPEAQAAFYNGYNTVPNCISLATGQPSGRPGGADQFGRCVLNPAGIDLSVEAAKQLGLGPNENAWATVSFLWEPLDTTIAVGHSGKNLDVNYVSLDRGAQAIQWPANGGRNQAWRFIPVAPNVFNIQVQHSGMYLDVEGASTADGARVIQWPANGGVNQQWRLEPVGTAGAYNFVAQHSGKLLDVAGVSLADGAPIIQWPRNGGANQQWRPAIAGL
ncbi:MAG: RICIN domain-containing protein [Actinomycetota bacterium]|nr:RICIN domain-containing protein [Actinomycetota bacterium]